MTNTGGPAFPCETIHPCGSHEQVDGLSIRDYFAAQAMTGAQIWDAILNGKNAQFSGSVETLAEVAYAVADAMLKAREQ